MNRSTSLTALLLLLGAATTSVLAQGAPGASAAGAYTTTAQQRANRGDPRVILAHSDSVLRADSLNYEALWRGALALVDIGQAAAPNIKSPMRDSAYARAEALARRAVRANPNDSEGHFAVSMALGNTSLSKGPKEKVRSATEIYREATRAVAIDSTHDGAWHVLGRWHAEILRVSSVERYFAKQFLGSAIFDKANWPEAVADLERAVRLDPTRITHRLDLAAVYVDVKRPDDARRELDAVRDLPAAQPNDTLFKRQGEELRRSVR